MQDNILIISVTQQWGGGSYLFVDQYVEQYCQGKGVFVLEQRRVDGAPKLALTDRQNNRTYTLDASEGALTNLTKHLEITSIVVNHLIEFDLLFIMNWIENSKLPYEYVIHDYHCVCVNQLFTCSGSFCSENMTNATCRFHFNHAGVPSVSVERYREIFGRFLSRAKHVYSPSSYAANIIRRFLPGVNVEVRPHRLTLPLTKTFEPKFAARDKLRIVFLGSIAPLKGETYLAAAEEFIRSNDLPIELIVLGSCQPPHKKITVHGKYDNRRVSELLASYEAAIVATMSTLHETYCYTASEAILSGYPVLALNIGAHSERISALDCGWLMPFNSPSRGVEELKTFLRFIVTPDGRKQIEAKAANTSRFQNGVEPVVDKVKEMVKINALNNGDEIVKINVIDKVEAGEKIPALSLIIPMRNAEQSIEQYLENILAQTFTDYELIVIDEHSKDRSVALVEKLAPKFNGRLKLVARDRKTNTTRARNIGLRLAIGEYVMFLDSDDRFKPSALQTLYDAARTSGADLVHADSVDKITVEPEALDARVRRFSESASWRTANNNLFRREFLVSNNLEFTDVKVSEIIFMFGCLCCSAISVSVPDGFFVRRSTRSDDDEDSASEPRRAPTKGAKKMLRTWDIFDTLIARRCIQPQRIFDLVEQRLGVKDFAKMRQTAEQMIIKLGIKFSITEIYQLLCQLLKVDESNVEPWKQVELDVELEQAIPIVENINQVRSGDVLISDIYLPDEVLRRMLAKCGLFVQVDLIVYNNAKASGKVWQQLRDRGAYVFHTGDNERSDVAKPREFGFDSAWTTLARPNPVESQLLAIDFEFAAYLRSLRLMNPFSEEAKRRYWSLFVINVGMMMLIAQLIDRVQKTYGFDYLGFCGRDTYYMRQIYQRLKSDRNESAPANNYLYYSRKLIRNSEADFLAYLKYEIGSRRALLIDLFGTGLNLNMLREKSGLEFSMLLCIVLDRKTASVVYPKFIRYLPTDWTSVNDSTVINVDGGGYHAISDCLIGSATDYRSSTTSSCLIARRITRRSA